MDRADDPDLAEKMKAEAEGIFLWAFEGLQRLVANNFKFTESDRIRENRKRSSVTITTFLTSGFRGIYPAQGGCVHQFQGLYAIYRLWCEENSLAPLKSAASAMPWLPMQRN